MPYKYPPAVPCSERLRDWILDNHLPDSMREPGAAKASPTRHLRRMKAMLKGHRTRTRLTQIWRKRMCERTGLPEAEVVRATNALMGLIEDTLARDTSVVVTGTGDLHVRYMPSGRRTIKFVIDPDWDRTLNPPTSLDDLGLRYRASQSGRVSHRALMEDA
jgi:hypothetical protein